MYPHGRRKAFFVLKHSKKPNEFNKGAKIVWSLTLLLFHIFTI
ncbi:hypothetical protein EVA_14315 [gut metagenome]|uniref:Uncharacterized protein n=1 Tax=gut metagenome TaxID=749906 RepID=J9GDZ4_9ZZZZ